MKLKNLALLSCLIILVILVFSINKKKASAQLAIWKLPEIFNMQSVKIQIQT